MKNNYSAGPCNFTARSFEKSAQAILDFNDSGLSILNIASVKILLLLYG
jgi:phosphoserine aminotransferase